MFELHQRIAADTVPVTEWPLCRVLLMNDSTYPWLLLVPRRAGVVEITDLDPADQHALLDEIARASTALRQALAPHRINVAALGNVVAQLHVHVIARDTDDAAWPKPVWGAVPATPYTPEALETRLAQLRAVLG
ncbi:HIT family protein [Paramagnetospirillum magneticum]|uniref:Diadenosine tetraphosphate hydrolase and other HIT family hydrolase n=1 Tax=Paramagnetospirillum magneticum (strain ATCC 700264 / AMB-1) TaxID=342108 RepID=Q2W7F2_PARM1|nr:HIT family protein [Paramagnetospirillum magneticum]BAE50223.1 Diadenosine tetraphosphate hydrolase and other HIT family hydrolase [Paramagnetospirillum magneticum AMB-1]